ncbi:hypothetical protein GQR58_020203 [Nymphon striatum]|nr:hypothetical protein GQR58_020203 [Nymphon striatum]
MLCIFKADQQIKSKIMKRLLIYLLVELCCHCGALDPTEQEIEVYLTDKLTEFQLDLHNEFQIRRLERSVHTGIPYRSTVTRKMCPFDLEFEHNTSELTAFDVARNENREIVTYGTIGGEVLIYSSTKVDSKKVFTVSNRISGLGGKVTHIATIEESPIGFFIVVAIELSEGGYRIFVYEILGDKLERKHVIDGKGVEDLALWENHGEFRIAILQASADAHGALTNKSEVAVYSISSTINHAKHASHFKIHLDQRIPLDFYGISVSYYFNTVQNLVISSMDPSNSVFFVYTTLTKSSHFVYNNLQTPLRKGVGTLTSIVPHSSADDLIAVYDNEKHELCIFNQDIRMRYHLDHHLTLAGNRLVDIKILVVTKTSTEAVILVLYLQSPPITTHACVFYIEVKPLNKSSDALVECMDELEDLIATNQKHINYLDENIDQVFVTDKNQTVTPEVIITGSVEVSNMSEIRNLIVSTESSTLSNISTRDILKDLNKTGSDLMKALDEFENVVLKSPNQTINGTVEYLEEIVALILDSEKITNDVTLNEEKISRIIDKTLKVVGSQTITNTLTLNNVIVNNNLNVKLSLNGYNPEDLIHNNESQTLSGVFTIENYVDFINLKLEKLNGVRPEDLALGEVVQVINGAKTFETILTSNIIVNQNTNSRDLSEFASKVVTLNGNHTITGSYIIENLFVDGNIHLEGLISHEINVTDLSENIVDKTSGQKINGHIIFEDTLRVTGNITATEINGVAIEELITLNTKQNISGDLVFVDKVVVLKNLGVDFVNKISPLTWVRRNEDFEIIAPKTFKQSIHIEGSIIMDDLITIDTVDPSALKSCVAPRKDLVNFAGHMNLTSLQVSGDVKFIQDANAVNITDIKQSFWRKSVFQTISVSVLTSLTANFDSITAEEVNGYSLEEDYVHILGNETIIGHVEFGEEVYVETDVEISINSTVNKYDISELAKNAIMKDGPSQEVVGPVYIQNLTVIDGDVIVVSTVNGFNISEGLMDKGSDQNITSLLIFTNKSRTVDLYVERIYLNELGGRGGINGVNIPDLYYRTVPVYKPTRVITGKTFTKLVVQDLDLYGTIGGINCTEFRENVVTLSTHQNVGGQKNFTGDNIFEKLVSIELLNNIKFTDYVKKVINKTEDTTVTGRKSIAGNVHVYGNIYMKAKKMVNNIDLSEFEKLIMFKDKFQVVSGVIWFNTEILEIEHLNSHGALDGIYPDDVALINRDTVLDGQIIFTSILVVDENLTVKGLVHNCDLYYLYTNAVMLTGVNSQTIDGSKMFDELNVQEPGHIVMLRNKTVNGEDISKLSYKALKIDGIQNGTGTYEFSSLRVKDLRLNGTLNKKDLTFFLHDAVLRDKNQTINSKKHFNEKVFFKKVSVQRNISVHYTVNNVYIDKLSDETVLKDSNKYIFGKKILNVVRASYLYITGYLNGVNITEDVWLIDSSDKLPGMTTFAVDRRVSTSSESIFIQGNMEVYGLIDGRNLSELISQRISSFSDQDVTPFLIFKDYVIVEGDCNFTGTLNEIDIEEIVKTIGNFTINGQKSFKKVTNFKSNVVVDLINNVNIKNLSKTSVKSDETSEIFALIKFKKEVLFKENLIVNGTVNRIDISDAAKRYYKMKKKVLKKLRKLQDQQYNRTGVQNFLQHAIEGQPVVPSYIRSVNIVKLKFNKFYTGGGAHLPDQNMPNPGALRAYMPTQDCLLSNVKCTCQKTCFIYFNKSSIALDYCSSDTELNICLDSSSTDCVKVKHPAYVSSETCPSSLLQAQVTMEGFSENFQIPKVTDGVVCNTKYGLIAVLAAPTDGTAEFEAILVRRIPVLNELKIVDKFEGSKGARFVVKIELEVHGIKSDMVAFATNRSVVLYHYNSYKDKFEGKSIFKLNCRPTGLLAVKLPRNETVLIVSCVFDHSGFLYEEYGPTLILFRTDQGRLECISETYTQQVFHISAMRYAGDIYVLASQTEDDKVGLFRLEGFRLLDTGVNIPITHPVATVTSYYKESNKMANLFISYLLLLCFCFCISTQEISSITPNDRQIEDYLSEKLVEFQLSLHNEFHTQRVNRAAPTGVPYRSVVSSESGLVPLGLPDPNDVVRFEVVHSKEYRFIIVGTVHKAILIYAATNDNPSNFQNIFDKHLEGDIVDITAIKAGKDIFLVFAVESSPGNNRLYVYEFTYNTFEFHHTIECVGVVLAKIALDFVFNNLQSPIADGTGTVISSTPHSYPDDLISVFDSSSNKVYIFNQDIRLRFHSNFELSTTGKVTEIKALLLSQDKNSAQVLVLLLQDNPKHHEFAKVLTIDIKPLNKSTDVLVECLENLDNLLDSRQESIDYLENNIGRVFVTDKNQTVTSDTIVAGKVTVHTFLKIRNLLVSSEFDEDMPEVTNREILDNLTDIYNRLNVSKTEFKKVVFKSTEQIIFDVVEYQAVVRIVHLKVDRISNDVIFNGERISRFIYSTLRTVGTQTIEYSLTIDTLYVNNNLKITLLLNGVSVEDFILTNAIQIIGGHYTFIGEVDFKELLLDYINGVNPGQLVLTKHSQKIHGLKIFNFVNTSHIIVKGHTNGHVLSDYASKVVTLSKNHTITGRFLIEHLHVDGNILIRGLISSHINVTDMSYYTVDKTTHGQVIKGHITFANHLHVAGNITTDNINGFKPSEFITLNTKQDISGELVFKSKFKVLKSLDVVVVNKIPTETWVRRNELFFDVSSRKIFNENIDVAGDIVMDDLVKIDGVDPSELNSTILPTGDYIEIHGAMTFDYLKVIDNLIFKDLVNGYDIRDVNKIFWRKSVFQTISVSVQTSRYVRFESNIHAENGVNGYDLDTDYVHVFGKETVTGHVDFFAEVCVYVDVEVAPKVTVNGYDISTLAGNAILKEGPPQEVVGTVTVSGNLTVLHGDVLVNSVVNGFDVSEDFLDKESEQTVKSSIRCAYRYTRVSVIKASHVRLVSGVINGYNLLEFVDTVVMIKHVTRPIVNKVFYKIIVENMTLNNCTVSGIDFKEFEKEVVTLSTNQTVGGEKVFTGHVLFERKVSLDYLNSIEFTPYVNSTIYKTKNVIVTGSKTITGNVYVNGDVHLKPQNTVNHVDLSRLGNVVMVRNKFQNVSGFIWFNTSKIEIENLKVIYGTLDEINPNDVALIHRSTILSGYLHFTKSVGIQGDLLVEGLVNGCDLFDLYTNGVKLHGSSQIIHGLKLSHQQNDLRRLSNFLTIKVQNNVSVHSTINGVDPDYLADETVYKNSNKTVMGSLNKLNISKDIWMVDTSDMLPHTTMFRSDSLKRSFEDSILIKGDITVHGLIDGKNLTELIATIITLSTEQNVTPYIDFKDTIVVEGNCDINSINGINPRKIVKTVGDFQIKDSKTFNNTVNFKNNVTVGLINHVDIVKLSRVGVESDASSVLQKKCVFKRKIKFEHKINVLGTVDGIDISAEADEYRILKDQFHEEITDLLNIQKNHTKAKNNLVHRLKGQTVVPSHIKGVDQYNRTVYKLYQSTNNLFDTHVNPKQLNGITSGTLCSGGCSCQRTCFYDVDGPSLTENSCHTGIYYEVCDGECFTVESPEVTSSDVCPNGVHTGLLKSEGAVIGISAPVIT